MCAHAGPLQSPVLGGGLVLFAALLALRGQWAVLAQWALIMGACIAACLLGEAEPPPDKQPNLALLVRTVRAAKGPAPWGSRLALQLQHLLPELILPWSRVGVPIVRHALK
jgi:hypothetical protein